MSLMKKFRTIDREIELLLQKQRQEKWLLLLMTLCEVENEIGREITNFRYDNGEVLVKLSDTDYVKTSIGDKYVQSDNKN